MIIKDRLKLRKMLLKIDRRTRKNYRGLLELWRLIPFQQYFSYIVAVNFIGGGNQST